MLAHILRQARPWIADFTTVRFPSRATRPSRVSVDFSVRNFRVKTIDSSAEMRKVLALRHEIFHHEFARKKFSLRSDYDQFDERADHLAIIDLKTDQIVGVYRLIRANEASEFYSDLEFDISSMTALTGKKLELSRACIKSEYRSGAVIALLWRGLAQYAATAGIDYLFGMGSINSMDIEKILKIHHYFVRNNHVSEKLFAPERKKYRIAGFSELMAGSSELSASEGETMVPSLIRSYIKAGAKICSQPVIDREFRCADWLTMLDMREIAEAYGRRFLSI